MSKHVFVDALEARGWRYGPNCHMMAADDSPEALSALHSVATELGLERTWFQSKSRWPHYDLTTAKRYEALSKGAVQIDIRAYMRMRRAQVRGWFVEPGSGLKMQLGCWYLLSDSGSYYHQRGFHRLEGAIIGAKQLKSYGLEPGDIGVCEPKKPDDLEMVHRCNVVKADDLLTFWTLTEPGFLSGAFIK